MKISLKGLALIKSSEGFSSKPYFCPGGYLTIGYGHAIETGEIFGSLTEPEASGLLVVDIERYERVIDMNVKVPLTQGRYDALASLVYNWGGQNFLKSQGLKKLNLSDYDGAAAEFFSRERGIVNIKSKFSQGLYNRRQAELRLWNEA